tara:strand:+ start:192 stop:434 length:243 start_codon:yes stop_codon:yes gene_type:complete
LNEGKLNQIIDGFELKCVVLNPRNGSEVIISKVVDISTLFRIFNIWRKIISTSFYFKPALANEELASLHIENCFRTNNKE